MNGRVEKGITTRDVVLVALFAAFIIALGLIPPITVGIVPVPITLQTLGVMLAGVVLGPVRGMLSCALVMLLVVVGLPVLAGGRGGIGVLAGPTGGYALGWIPGALVTGLLVKYWAVRLTRHWARIAAYALSCVVGGILVVYLLGVPWLSVATGVTLGKAVVGNLVFLPGDLIKAVAAALIGHGVHRSYSMPLK
ncbi:biotin transport system substrate-specific component [Streptosporangium becharense]|uniref:Biotin transporter n=1 Tax=Streptosporangium becharense TaxID=1816182 RepID=A0A7W9IB24_9ACTN|nr:biotin transporter BioY [Streptosporangium becharense]MBB2910719.1 biotin transport system substrate-specific component [Streptosporangium becharense]MBB5817414.1 biotin transport system substrate-specific component [Streptosporangium becharense]